MRSLKTAQNAQAHIMPWVTGLTLDFGDIRDVTSQDKTHKSNLVLKVTSGLRERKEQLENNYNKGN